LKYWQVAEQFECSLYICVMYREHARVESKAESMWAELPSLCTLYSAQVNTVR